MIVHNAYQRRGGEDSVVESERELLRSHGHDVEIYCRDNSAISAVPGPTLALQTLWSHRTEREIREAITRFRPDVIHVHNTFPLISPSLYWAAHKARTPVIQTLHNFRLVCPQAMLLRDGKVCEDCVGKIPWRAVVHRCYRRSASQSALSAGSITLHRLIGTYARRINRYIALSQFARAKFVEGGLPPDKLVIKPHFVDIARAADRPREGGLFVGRLSPEKGTAVLAQALSRWDGGALTVAGTGPDEAHVSSTKAHMAGYVRPSDVYSKMRLAAYLVMPSIWYENFPRTIVEAFACGLPVIASRAGSLAELVEDGKTGLLFEPGSADDLVNKMRWAEQHPEQLAKMGRNARAEYESKYTPDLNYQHLIDIYGQAIADNNAGRPLGRGIA